MAIPFFENEDQYKKNSNFFYISIQEGIGRTIKEKYTINGILHSDVGPAIIYENGDTEWWISGEKYSFSAWCEEVRISNYEKIELALKYG